MPQFSSLTPVVVAGLVLMLNVAPSWAQPACAAPGCNPTASDANANSAGGTHALLNVVPGFSGGFFNTAFGASALVRTTIGNENTGYGNQTLYSNVTGSDNTASGGSALFANTTGDANTANGVKALFANSTGVGNTAVGRSALLQSVGNKNIAIGYKAGATLTTGNNNIFIGNQGAGDESQTIRVGTAQTRTFIAGIANASVGNAATVIIDTATGQLGTLTSSARYKQDIAPMASQSEGVLQLHPVTFAYKADAQHVKHYGLVAEEVAVVYPELVTHAASGEVQAVKYQELIPMLLNELQRQRHEFQQALQSQQKELAELRALVGQSRGKVVLGATGE
jgi:Chaperone of endosialidase